MAAALMTAMLLSIGLLVAGLAFGFTASTPVEIFRHTSVSIFATLMTLLSHSLIMFYLIGKGRAVREAVVEGGLSAEFVAAIARVRRPVFSAASLAIAVTMASAILGGGADTGAVPSVVHSGLGVAAVAVNLAAFRLEAIALLASARIVGEVNRALESHGAA